MIWFRVNNQIIDLSSCHRIYKKDKTILADEMFEIIAESSFDEPTILWSGKDETLADNLLDRIWGAIIDEKLGAFIEAG